MTKSKKKSKKYKHLYKTQKIKLHKLKNWIFDFGGVLVESAHVVYGLVEMMNDDLGTNMSKTDPFVSTHRERMSAGKINARQFLTILLDEYYYPHQKENGSLPAKKVNIDYYLELWFNLYSLMTQLSEEMEEIIERLHQAGYRVHLMSNTYGIHAKSNLLKGFFDMFDQVFLSNVLGVRKPKMEKYKHVLNELDAKPKSCIFIDDKPQNLIPARELGIKVIHFKSVENFKQILKQMGIKKIKRNLRRKIKKKYKTYKETKKKYKKAKKKYKKAKKKYKKAKKKWKKKRKLKYAFQKRKFKKLKKSLKSKKKNFKKEKKSIKNDLIVKFKPLEG